MKTTTFFTFTSVDSNGNVGDLGNHRKDNFFLKPSVNDELTYELENRLDFVGVVHKVVVRIGLSDEHCVDVYCKGVIKDRM